MTTKETPNAYARRELLEGVVGRALKPGSTVESVLDEQRERYGIVGYVVRADGLYLSSYFAWFSEHLEGAWVHETLPRGVENWDTQPEEYAAATWSEAIGIRLVGEWKPYAVLDPAADPR